MLGKEKLSELSEEKFQEMISSLQYSSLRASNLSSNVAMAFLSNIPCDIKFEDDLISDIEGYDRPCIEYYEDDKNFPSEDGLDTNAFQLCEHKSPPAKVDVRRPLDRRKGSRWGFKIFDKLGSLYKNQVDHAKSSGGLIERRAKKEKFYISYEKLMVPSNYRYDPKFLDIPIYEQEYKPGSEEVKLFRLDSTPESQVDAIIYVPLESNELFRQKHPWLNPTLSLSKLCHVKSSLLTLPNVVKHLDPSTAAIAWTIFERLLILGIITKSNHSLYAATCLILSYKFNQDFESDVMNDILNHLTRNRNIDVKLIFSNEMKVFTFLDFSLKMQYSYIQTHIHQYLEYNKLSFFNLYDTQESTYLSMDNR